jgi:DNA-directed RNA polymerase subunit M/transcription elongation factor TFIIS
MHFCSECHNMYYMKISDDDGNTLIYYCRNCGHEDAILTSENICVSDVHIKRTEQNYSQIINEYTKLDPTLPRIKTIKCPNAACSSNKPDGEAKREVIYIRYDDTHLKYIYLCTQCDQTWKTNDTS